MRIALGVEYDGSHFYGWQRQLQLRTVQNELEKALSKIANQPITVHCAGRTDTGVHAVSQVVHFDTTAERPLRSWILGCNSNLPRDVSVCWAQPVSDDFHARFSAQARRYIYIIYNDIVRNSLFANYVTWQYRALDAEKMAATTKYFLGTHDFTSFRALNCQAKSPVRHVEKFTVVRRNKLIILDITANAFLQHMIRNIAGTLIAVGSGKREIAWVDEVLQAKDRAVAAETAPPYGLYLQQVRYPEIFNLPLPSASPFFLGAIDDCCVA